jgi:serine/threonine protein kinase
MAPSLRRSIHVSTSRDGGLPQDGALPLGALRGATGVGVVSPAPGGSGAAAGDPNGRLQSGAMLGPFRIIDRLGAGGMGEVYRAMDTRLGRDVALKVLPEELLSNSEGLARFALEARSASALNHPNIVTIFEVGQAGSSPYLAMELINGWTLRELMEAGALPVKKVLDLATQIGSGLAKAHQAGIVHRDLKPENIMVSQDGFVKILDFGLAKLQGPMHGAAGPAGASLTQAGLIIGTPAYMSPEQAADRPLDFRSDQFSAALVIYEMLTHRSLFQRATPVQTLSAIIQDDPFPLDGLGPTVPPPLRWAIERCLAKEPADRYGSTAELARDLKQIRDKLADFRPVSDHQGSQMGARAAGPGSPTPQPSMRSAMPSALREAAPASTHLAPAPAAAHGKVRRIREFALVLLLGLALFAGGAFAGHWFRSRQVDAPAPIWKGNLLVGPMTRVMAPRSSPDGQTLAFLTLVGGRAQVAVMKPSSGDWAVLTRRADSGSVYKVCWSRDGDKLFFDRVSDVPRGIFSVPPLGGEERTVLEDAQGPETLPDGSLLVVKRDAARNYQIHRFRPDTGVLKPLGPAVVAEGGTWSLRAFPDGKTAVFWGRLAGSTDPARRVYLLDVASGRALPFAPQLPLAPPLAIGSDGNSVLAFVTFGDLQQAITVSRDGQQGKVLFPVTGKPWGLDAGTDGSVIVSTMDSPAELLRVPATGGVPDQLVTMAGNLLTSPVQIADGGMLIPNQVLGRRRLLISAPDGQLRPFLDLAEQATPPAALVGESLVAFLSGGVGQPQMITVATMPEGRIVRRLEATKGIAPQSLVAAPDGKTLYYVNAGSLFSIGIEGGTPRKIRSANGVAVDPREPASLIVQVNEPDGVKLIRAPLSGGSEISILFASPLRLAPIPISATAVGPDGRIAVTVTSPDTLFRGIALLDPATAVLERLSVVFDGDIQYPAWGRDGSLLAIGVSIRSSLWRFQPQTQSKP